MMDCKWFRYEIIWFYRKVMHKLFNKKYPIIPFKGEKNRDMEEMSQVLRQYILKDVPFVLCRMGTSELTSFVFYQRDRKYGTHTMKKRYKISQFFKESEVERYINLIKKDVKDVDISIHMSGVGVAMEEWFYERYLSSSVVMNHSALNFYFQKTPWTSALKGKKVLVVNPFAKTIESQYKKRKLLFENQDVLPEMDLKTFRALWYTSRGEGGYESWFDALDYMYNEIMKIDFEIAILGCGYHGFHLAVMLKRAGKKAIHLGGITQILFGIKGSRWDNMPDIKALYNEHWVRPEQADKPENVDILDKGCYW